jgi:hypothetical protein
VGEVREWAVFIAQNTGWSGGVSWFDTVPFNSNFVGFSNPRDAKAANKAMHKRMKDPSILYRVIKRTTREEVVCA